MSLVITDPNDIDLVRRALQRYRKEQITKRIKFKNGEWKGDSDHVEQHIAACDRMIELVGAFQVADIVEHGVGEAVVTPKRRFA